jgi:xanthine dehydrogenase accessory factor
MTEPTIGTILPAPQAPYQAFMTEDDKAILKYAIDGAESRHGCALVTLVDIRGGAARALGAQMAVRGDGGYCGYVSGGCTEATVAAEAVAAIGIGNDRYLKLGEGSTFFDIRLPCGGGITLAIHVITNPKPLRQVLDYIGKRTSACLTYNPESQTITAQMVSTSLPSGWRGQSFSRSYRPSVRLVIFGRGIENVATSRLAASADFEVFSYDRMSPQFFESDIDPDTAVVILFHDIELELPCLKISLDRNPFYLGALGSARTHERRCSALREAGYDHVQMSKIKAPIGLFGPTRNANSLALSIVADIDNVRSQSII